MKPHYHKILTGSNCYGIYNMVKEKPAKHGVGTA